MGYMRHHAIIVTSWERDALAVAHQRAREIGCALTPIVSSPTNGYGTFVVVPDGSKEGWDLSDTGDAQRGQFVQWLNEQRYEDSSSRFEWAEVQYGDDAGDDRLLLTDVTALVRRRR